MSKKYKVQLVAGKLKCVSQRSCVKWTVAAVEDLLRRMVAWLSNPDEDNIFPSEFLVKEGHYPNLLADKIKDFQKSDPMPDLTEIYRLYSIAKKISEIRTAKGGLTKKYDPTITKLILSQHHGYKSELEQSARGGFFFQQNVINPAVQSKDAAELSRYYQQVIRGLPGSQSIPLPGAEEIPADIE